MNGSLPQIGLVLALVLLNAAFAGSEIALLSLREGQLARLREQGGSGRVLADLAGDPNRFLATIQIGITLAGFLASATAAVTLAESLIEPLRFLGRAARPVAVVLVTFALTYVTLVAGELAPKRLAMQRAERWGLIAAHPLAFLARLTRPLVWLLGASSDLLVRLAGADPAANRETVTEEEVRDLIVAQASFTRHQREIMLSALEIDERRLEEVLVPRTATLAFETSMPARDALDALRRAGHSRAPVYRGDLDEVIGVVHLRDLIDAEGMVGEHASEPLMLPESVSVLSTLRDMQRTRQQLALVVNEYGGIEGMVTIEDLIEEVVGEIYDEYDRDVRAARRLPDGGWELVGRFPIHDLEDLGLDLPEGDYSTIAGLVLDRLGRIPRQGDRCEIADWVIEVTDVRRNAITRVRVSPRGSEPRRSDHGM